MKIGSLCSGYEGLGMGVQAALGGELAWVSDIDPGANRILGHRYPHLPNLGDFTVTDWSTVEPVEVLTAGFPCQPVSHAGKRLGDEDERWLWDDVARAVRELRPGLVVLENVRGLLSAGGGRLFGRVLGTLAQLGYDAQWHGLRAADVGAPHGRWRVFITAWDTNGLRLEGRRFGIRRTGERVARPTSGQSLLPPPRATRGGSATETVSLLPTPVADNSGGLPSSGTDYASLPNVVCALLPTPAVNDMGEGKTPDAWDEWTAKMQAAHGNGNGHGKSLAIEAQRLLPTPTSSDAKASGAAGYNGNEFCTLTDATVRGKGYMDRPDDTSQWGDYAPAIARWEATLGRPAPAPTEPGPKGSPRLSPKFVEWMMGLPAGWVTDVPGLTRNAQLKALGNGVVWLQAEAAIRLMLSRVEVAA